MVLDKNLYIQKLREGLSNKPSKLRNVIMMSITRIQRMTEQEWVDFIEENRSKRIVKRGY